VIFKNREEAFECLIKEMPIDTMKKEQEWVVLSISTEGIFYAKKIAMLLGRKSDYLFTEKIYTPNNKECAIAIVSETGEVVINEELAHSFDINYDYIYAEAARKHDDKVLGYFYKYRQGEVIGNLKDKNVLLVDEGADTGMTLAVGLKSVINLSVAKVAVAIPIIPESIAIELEKIADELYTAKRVKNYVDIWTYFRELPPYEIDTMGRFDGKYCTIKK